jgi:very-short-patch-repair endonuclease
LFLDNQKKHKGIRRKLRKNQTEFETLLWGQLRGKRFYELKFYRQYSVGRYVLDFYCPSKRIAIEVDGSQHLENKEYDDERTEFLESLGIQVLRIWNNEVSNNMAGVLEKLYKIAFPKNI